MRYIRQGFTLIEMLIIATIIGVIAILSVLMFQNNIKKAQKATCIANRSLLKEAVEMEYIMGRYNSHAKAFDNLVAQSKTCPCDGNFKWINNDSSGYIVCSVHDDVNNRPISVLKQTPGVREKLNAGQELERGTILADETGACIVLSYTYSFGQLAKIKSVRELAEKYEGIFLLRDEAIVTREELDVNPNRASGTICEYKNKYYYATMNTNQWNKPPGGIWVEIKQ